MASNKISQFIDGVVVHGLSFLNSKEEITEGCRLFYEIVTVNNIETYNIIQTGMYKEIKDPVEAKMNDDLLDELWYIRYHGFLIKHKGKD